MKPPLVVIDATVFKLNDLANCLSICQVFFSNEYFSIYDVLVAQEFCLVEIQVILITFGIVSIYSAHAAHLNGEYSK